MSLRTKPDRGQKLPPALLSIMMKPPPAPTREYMETVRMKREAELRLAAERSRDQQISN